MAFDQSTLERMYLALLEAYHVAVSFEQEQRNALAKVTRLSADDPRRKNVEQEYRAAYMEVVLSKGKITEFLSVHPNFIVPQQQQSA